MKNIEQQIETLTGSTIANVRAEEWGVDSGTVTLADGRDIDVYWAPAFMVNLILDARSGAVVYAPVVSTAPALNLASLLVVA